MGCSSNISSLLFGRTFKFANDFEVPNSFETSNSYFPASIKNVYFLNL